MAASGRQQLAFAIRAINEAKSELGQVSGDIDKVGRSVEEADRKSSGFGAKLGNIATIAGGFVLGQGLLQLPGLIGGMIGGASNLNESLSKVQTVFGTNAAAVEAWSKTTAAGMGISRSAALEATGTFGNLFTAMGLGAKPAADLSMNIVGLSADLASFNNLSPDEVLEKLRAGLVGEAEPLRALGVNMNAAAVEAKALEMGMKPLNGEFTEAQKIQARYAIILEQTKTAQGDFARTSTGHANQMRILKAEFADIRDRIGTALLPVVVSLGQGFLGLVTAAEPLVDVLAGGVSAGIDALGGAFDKLSGPLGTAAGAVTDFVAGIASDAWGVITDTIVPALQPFAEMAWDGLVSGAKAVAEFATNLASDAWALLTDTIVPALKDLANITWGALQTGFGATADAAKRLVDAGLDRFGGHLDAIKSGITGIDLGTFASAWDKVTKALQPAVDFLRPLAERVLDSLKKALQDVGERLKPLGEAFAELGAALKPLTPLLEPLGKVIGVVIVAAIGALLIALDLFIKILGGALTVAIDAIILVIKGLVLAIEGITKAVEFIYDGVTKAIPLVKSAFIDVKDAITGVLDTVITFVKNLGRDILGWIWDGIEASKDWFMSKLNGFIDGMKSALNPKNWFGSPQGIQNWFPYYLDQAVDNMYAWLDTGRMAGVGAAIAKELSTAIGAAVAQAGADALYGPAFAANGGIAIGTAVSGMQTADGRAVAPGGSFARPYGPTVTFGGGKIPPGANPNDPKPGDPMGRTWQEWANGQLYASGSPLQPQYAAGGSPGSGVIAVPYGYDPVTGLPTSGYRDPYGYKGDLASLGYSIGDGGQIVPPGFVSDGLYYVTPAGASGGNGGFIPGGGGSVSGGGEVVSLLRRILAALTHEQRISIDTPSLARSLRAEFGATLR